MKKIGKIVFSFILYLLLFINIIAFFECFWIEENIGIVSIQEVIFHIRVPLKGTSSSLIMDNVVRCIIPTILIFSLIVFLTIRKGKKYSLFTISINRKNIQVKVKSILLFILLLINIFLVIIQFNNYDSKFKIVEYFKFQTQSSDFIEKNYVNPKDVKIKFPEEKRNLIYIYLESMESNYSDSFLDGNDNVNIIPELYTVATENINFSDTDGFGGAYPISGTGWTSSAMVSQTAGLPLNLPIDSNTYIGYDYFLPYIVNLGDILKENGYNQEIIMGSDSDFSGKSTYYKTHGSYTIKDLFTAREEGIIPKDYYKFWGFEDSYLFEYAKKELHDISLKEEPFNFTLLTVNSHFPDGIVEDGCELISESNDYANSIRCSSKQVFDFINWIKEQDFYENTTIVVVGDHLSMATNEIYKLDYNDRRIYNTIINSKIEERNTKNRKFTTLDLFPTTLASIGVEIEGNKLGLGVNLFSDEKTIIEKNEFDFVNSELIKKSDFYDRFIYKN